MSPADPTPPTPRPAAPPPGETAALITGGAGGLGRAVAKRLDAAGYRVVLLVRDTAKGRAVAGELQGEAAVHACDVTDRTAVSAAIRRTAQDIAPPLVLINAAGIAESSGLLPPDDALWNRTMAVNVTGAWIAATECLPYMKDAEWGFISNVASTAALEGYAYTAAYCASKHALLGLTRAMAKDLSKTHVRVSAVCPGFLDTPMTDRTIANMVAKTGMSEDEARAALGGMNRSGTLIAPDTVAEAIVSQLMSNEPCDDVLRLD